MFNAATSYGESTTGCWNRLGQGKTAAALGALQTVYSMLETTLRAVSQTSADNQGLSTVTNEQSSHRLGTGEDTMEHYIDSATIHRRVKSGASGDKSCIAELFASAQ